MSSPETPAPLPVNLRLRRYAATDDLGEAILLRTYQGDAAQLHRSLGELRLLRDHDRTLAVRGLFAILNERLNKGMVLGRADVQEAVEEWFDAEVMDDDRPAYDPDLPLEAA